MTELIQNILYILITASGVLLIKCLMNFINSKIDELQIEKEIKDNELLNQYIDTAQQVVYDVVLMVTQTYVENLKQHGNFTKEAQKHAKEMALETAKALISEEAKNAIIVVYGDLDLYLSNLLESIVNQNKTIK